MSAKVQYKVTATPDFGGFSFYVEEGRSFEITDYCDAYGLNRHDFDEESVKAAQNAAAQLNPGQWLEISHEVECDDLE